MKKSHLFWGITAILCAAILIISQVSPFTVISPWSIILSVLLVALIVVSIVKVNFFGIFVPVALLYNIYQTVLVLPDISIWILILAAVLLSIGFSAIFSQVKKRMNMKKASHFAYNNGGSCGGNYNSYGGMRPDSEINDNNDDNYPIIKVSFGGTNRYLHADCLTGGELSVSFGALELFLDQSVISPNGAMMSVDCSFGSIKLYIPKTWRVESKVTASLGGVENDTRRAMPDPNAPLLTLIGSVNMGALEIQYV